MDGFKKIGEKIKYYREKRALVYAKSIFAK